VLLGAERELMLDWVQRIRTVGGVAPATGCSQSTDVGALALVPYSTDYVFFH